jgi:type IV secretion system protein VirD4
MQVTTEDNVLGFLILTIMLMALVLAYRRRWRPGNLLGDSSWATDRFLKAWGMFGNRGLIIGRSLSGTLIRIQDYCHAIIIGGTGSGKGVGYAIPTLLSYFRGSVVVFDTKGDLFKTCGPARAKAGIRNVVLAPFGEGGDFWNPLDTIPPDDPLLFNKARVLASALVVRAPDERDPHWSEKAMQIITGILVYVLTHLHPDNRNLNSVQDIAGSADGLLHTAEKLIERGGIFARFGRAIQLMFEKDAVLSKEGASILSNATRHLTFLDSPLVARHLRWSTFDVKSLLRPGVTLWLQIPPRLLDGHKGLLRCWVSTLISETLEGSEDDSEILFLLDECSALAGLEPLREMLVRGRSSGLRSILIYQLYSQVASAFPDQPTLLEDNCNLHIYLNAGGIETAERLSRMCGNYTAVVDSAGNNWSQSQSIGSASASGSITEGGSTNYAQQGLPLIRAENAMRLRNDCFLAFLGGFPSPILGRKIRWFEDPLFVPSVKQRRRVRVQVKPLVLGGLVLLLLGLWSRVHMQARGYYRALQSERQVKHGQDRPGPRIGNGPARPQGTPQRIQPQPGKRGGLGAGAVRRDDPRGNRPRP